MKLFGRKNKDDDEFEDDDSIPPPPPPDTESQVYADASYVSSPEQSFRDRNLADTPEYAVKGSREQADTPDTVNAEDSPFVSKRFTFEDAHDDVQNTKKGKKGYSQVPISGQFRGMQQAQTFDEQEAGMDEVEVSSSSVVDRWNKWERKYAWRKKWRMVAILSFAVIVGTLAITLGIVFGTRASRSRGNVSNNASGEGDNTDTGGAGDNSTDAGDTTDGGDNTNNSPTIPPYLDTPAGKIILKSSLLPESTKSDLENEDSAAYKALDWIQNSADNEGFGFDDETSMQDEGVQLELMQRFALANLQKSINGDIEGWMNEDVVCDWTGVICGDGNERLMQEREAKILGISIADQGLQGPISPALSMLQDLEKLEMYGNELTGEIPEELFSLTKLITLDLYRNNLAGSIPSSIGNLVNLENLYLGKNDFTGKIPSELFNLENLYNLWLDGLTSFDEQELPAGIGNLVNLLHLKANDSNFKGALPAEIGLLVNLEVLMLARNKFEGIFDDIELPTSLVTLDLSNNSLSDTLIKLHDYTNLMVLRLHGNNAEGRIPFHYGLLENLVELRLGPGLIGGIPGSLNTIVSLEILDLRENNLTGAIPEEFGNLVELRILNLQDNKLTGEVPDTLSNLEKLEKLFVKGNNLEGSIPDGICELEASEVEADCTVLCQCCTDSCNRD